MNMNQQNVNVNLDDIISNNGSVQNEEARPLSKKENMKRIARQKRKENYKSAANVRGTGKRLYDMFYAQNNLDEKHEKLRSRRQTRKNKYKNGTEIRGMNKSLHSLFNEKIEENNSSRKLTKAQLRKRQSRQTRKEKKNKHGVNKPGMAKRLSGLFGMYNNEENMNESVPEPKKTVRFTSNVEYNDYLQNVFRGMPEQEGIPNGAKERFIERVIVPEGKTLKQLRLSLISQSSKLMKNVSHYYEEIVSYLHQLRLLEQMILYQESQGIELATIKPKRNVSVTRPPVNPAKPPRECPEGQEVSARTGRCIKKCVHPQVRNPETGRCKKP